MEKAIIGGTGVYALADNIKVVTVETAYGSVDVDVATINGEEIAFLARHGKEHSVPPHLINYRANMKALQQLGVKYVWGLVTVGSMNENFGPGSIVVANDFIDFTTSRIQTFFKQGETGVIHTDMSDPYCKNMRGLYHETAKELGIDIAGDGVYFCFEGPRFETASEIRFFQMAGGDIIGMTNVPEVVLAKELGLCYSAIGLVSNFCTGIKNENFADKDISGIIKDSKEKAIEVCLKAFEKDLDQNHCRCTSSNLIA